MREDHVLDNELPLWAPIPALAEIEVALELAVGEVTGLAGFELKRVMRTGTVASVDNRNWEIGDPAIIRRLSQSRAIALDMESAAIAANGFRFSVPYGTLLCVSDKPLHGEIKLAGMAGNSTASVSANISRSGQGHWKNSRHRIGNACTRANSEASPRSRSNSTPQTIIHVLYLHLVAERATKPCFFCPLRTDSDLRLAGSTIDKTQMSHDPRGRSM